MAIVSNTVNGGEAAPGSSRRAIGQGRSAGARRLSLLGLIVAVGASGCSIVGPGTPLAGQVRGTLERAISGAIGLSDLAADVARGDRGRPRDKGPRIRVIRLKPRPQPGPFRMDLYEKGDFVHQRTKDWCVAGSTQTMMNIIDKGTANHSPSFQRHLYLTGRRISPMKRKLGPIGVDLVGWAGLLDRHGYGPYVVDGARTRKGAIRKAARALRMTGRPVGLVTWRGAHSWVMSGFTATADPAFTRDFRVTNVHIEDTWYPYVSTIWGASRPPDSLVPVAALAEDYLPYRRPLGRYPKRDGRFMLILPALPPNTVAR